MGLTLDLYNFTLLLLCIIGSCSFIYILTKGKRSPLFSSFVWLIFLSLLWGYGYVCEWSSILNKDTWSGWTFVVIQDFALSCIGIACLHLAVVLTNHKLLKHWLYYIIRFAIPAFFFIMVLTNKLHHLVYTEYSIDKISFGPVLIGICSIIMICLGLSIYFLILYIKKNPGYINKQAKTLCIIYTIVFICMILDAIYIDRLGILTLVGGYYFSVSSAALTVNLYCAAALNYHFLQVTSFTLHRIVEQMPKPVLIIDQDNNISITNQSFNQLFNIYPIQKNDIKLESLIHKIEEKILLSETPNNFLNLLVNEKSKSLNGEVSFKSNYPSYYLFFILRITK